MTIIHIHSCAYRSKCVPLETTRPERVVRALMLGSEMEEGSKAIQEPASLPACQPAALTPPGSWKPYQAKSFLSLMIYSSTSNTLSAYAFFGQDPK